MGRTVEINGGINRIDGPVEVLEVHGGVVNVSGRVGAVNQFGGVLNGKTDFSNQSEPKVIYRDRVVYRDRIVYRDRPVEKVEYRAMSDDILVGKITRLENELSAERKAHRQEVNELKERLDGAMDAYHRLLHPKPPKKPKLYHAWDDYRPTKQECEAVYKNLKVWMECEQELEPINLF